MSYGFAGVVVRPLMLVGLAITMLLIAALHALAAPPAAPDEAVARFAARAVTVLEQRSERAPVGDLDRAMTTLLREGFDLDTIAKLTLGRHWRTAGDEDRADFRALFERYLVVTYGRRLEGYGGQTVRVTGWSPVGDDALVTSSIENPGDGGGVRVDWRLRASDAGWRILDVVVEGVSMLVTQRSEFAAIVERAGGRVSALNDHLRRALNEAPRSAADTPPTRPAPG
ncbi:MAG: ABC transporter substrate-binding protein [Geminicoccaceae bacterium]|nr:ABC transporter substrate-binding protein [Geminicoccaceae bacterium]